MLNRQLIYLLVISFLSIPTVAQNTKFNPNKRAKAAGLTEWHIETACKAAAGLNDRPFQAKDWDIPVLFVYMLGFARKSYPDMTKEEVGEFLRQEWDEKYSHVHCNMISDSVHGSLDMTAVYFENIAWVDMLYSPHGDIKSDKINQIKIINTYLEKAGTLMDFYEEILEINPVASAAASDYKNARLKEIETFRSKEYGAKYKREIPKEKREVFDFSGNR